jgi:zinc transporter ZupT
MQAEPTILLVVFAALITALATGLGAVPFVFGHKPSSFWIGLGASLAAGLMLAASFTLLREGMEAGWSRALLGCGVGAVLMTAADKWLERQGNLSIGDLSGADARKALLIIATMTVHSLAEGIGVGVSFGGDGNLGAFITLAIAMHNIPEGLAIATVMVPRGTPVWKAGAWSIASSLPQPVMAAPAFAFVLIFAPVLPFGLGLAAGAMIWVIMAELLPDALKNVSPALTGAVTTLAAVAMLALQGLLPSA